VQTVADGAVIIWQAQISLWGCRYCRCWWGDWRTPVPSWLALVLVGCCEWEVFYFNLAPVLPPCLRRN